MMCFMGCGVVNEIKNYRDNIIIVVRDTQMSYTSSSGMKSGERDFKWFLVPRTVAEAKFYKSILRVGAKVWFSGKIMYRKKNEESTEEATRSDITFRLDRLDPYNDGDPKKQYMREKYNDKVVGEDKPDINNSFENDF